MRHGLISPGRRRQRTVEPVSLAACMAMFALLAPSSPLAAQTTAPDSALVTILEAAVSNEWKLRVDAPAMIEGVAASYEAGVLTLHDGSRIAAADIRSIRRGRSSMGPAIIGAVLGGVLIGPPIDYFLMPRGGGGLVNGGHAAGLIIGALIGASVELFRWQTLWTMEERRH